MPQVFLSAPNHTVSLVGPPLMTCHSHPQPWASCIAHHSLSPNPLHPHILVPDHLTRWLTPFSIDHMNSLMEFFPPRLIAMSHILVSKSVATSTLSNYSSSLICFSWFCDDYHVPEQLQMLASEALLLLFITCWAMASVSASTMQCITTLWLWVGIWPISSSHTPYPAYMHCISGHLLWVDMVSICTFGCSGRSGLTMWRTKRSDFELGLYCLGLYFFSLHISIWLGTTPVTWYMTP